jgi:hypothetical protein
MNLINSIKLEKSALVISSIYEESDEKAYWSSKTPYERLEALEIMRQMIYGYDPTTTRLQRILTITQRVPG